MGQRKYGRPRCAGCGLHEVLCVCADLPVVDLSTRIVVVQAIRERFKPTNTGKLVPRTLRNSLLLPWGLREPPFDPTPLRDAAFEHLVLFPREDAVPLTEIGEICSSRPHCFVVLDGTWHQCSRMARRVPAVMDMRCVSLPPGPESRWVARRQHDPRGVSTYEAVIRLVRHVEGPEAAAPLEAAFDRLAAGVMRMKGIASGAATG